MVLQICGILYAIRNVNLDIHSVRLVHENYYDKNLRGHFFVNLQLTFLVGNSSIYNVQPSGYAVRNCSHASSLRGYDSVLREPIPLGHSIAAQTNETDYRQQNCELYLNVRKTMLNF